MGYALIGWNSGEDGTGTLYNAGESYTPAESVTLYAQWATGYMVTFDADGGSPATQERTVIAGGIVGTPNKPSDPTRDHYTFGGWWTVRNGGGSPFYVDTVIDGNITFYAKWTVIKYTVTFDADGGSPTGQQKMVDGGAWVGTPNMPPAPAKDGSIFGGWYTAKNGGGSQFYVDTVVAGNMTVYAKWTLDAGIQYTVTFDADGGSAVAGKKVSNGGSVGSDMPAAPTKSGYVFGGWYTAKNGGGTPFTAETTVTSDVTVYARWTQQWTVTFDADGGSPTPQPKTALAGSSIGVSEMPSDPAKTHYTFGGWYTAKDGGGTAFTGSTPVTGDITVYAKWTDIQYTVTFNTDGGNYATEAKTVNSGGSVGAAMPANPVRVPYTFGGWYTAPNGGGTAFTSSTVVTTNITVYAKWTSLLDKSLDQISANAVNGGAYTITLTANETIAPKTLSYSGKKVSITLKGDTSARTVSLSATGSMFTVESGVTLTLGNNVTLKGRDGNTASLVKVNSGGALVMNTGSKISGNGGVYQGGGVYVSYGTFTMSGGEISGNTASGGGGVYVSDGTFTVNGGEISGNTASYGGGGVYILRSTFTMNGGEISGNTVSTAHGGGVYVDPNSTFTMDGGEISGNTASSWGGGVFVFSAAFTMRGGEILGNTASYGGGVFVYSAAFTMRGGEISGNTASSGDGGGVGIRVSSTFTMNGGEISGNTASSWGGGVYVESSDSTFTKPSGGTIYGSNTDTALKNTATNGDSYGHAVYAGGKKRNSTAGEGATLDSTVSGAAGGWE
jgi:uncharacterized repeat protein (TIGR02543 family)